MARNRRSGVARQGGKKSGRGFTVAQLEALGVDVAAFRQENPLPAAVATREAIAAGPKRNATEARYGAWLDGELLAGRIAGYVFEPLRLRLGPDWLTTYTPDFLVQLVGGELELHDVKGASTSAGSTAGAWWEEDARLKIKLAAGLYPFRFVGVHEGRAGAGEPAWVREVFPPG